MLRLLVVLLAVLAGQLTAAVPPAARDVKVGDPLRKPLLDALRPEVEKDLEQKLRFVVRVLRVEGDWAFADLQPRTPAGKEIDFSKTRHAERQREGMLDDDTLYALLERRDGRWQVRAFVIGPTDVAWAGWTDEYGAPEAIFALPPE
jgi:hypothetical protein